MIELNNPVIAKLSKVVELSAGDNHIFNELCKTTILVNSRRDIISDGSRQNGVYLLLDGWACRYKTLKDGKRQIIAILIPGDFCNLHVGIYDQMDHAVGAITATTLAYVDRVQFDALTQSRLAVMRALRWTALVDESLSRSWLVSLGVRNARERLAHLVCELRERSSNIGLVKNNHFPMPLTQNDLGDSLGLTPVHINRVVRALAVEQLLKIERGTVSIINLIELRKIAEFDNNIFHQSLVY